MAFDKKGKYHMNPHHAKMADEADGKHGKEGSAEEEATEPKGEAQAEGDTEDGPHKMLQDMQAKHGGTHMHVHQHDAGITTHHVGEDGEVQGPHEHPDLEALHAHMSQVMPGHGAMAQEQPMHQPSGSPMAMSGY